VNAPTPRQVATETAEHWLIRRGIPSDTARAYALELITAITEKGIGFTAAAPVARGFCPTHGAPHPCQGCAGDAKAAPEHAGGAR
jgi:hypothetical protein